MSSLWWLSSLCAVGKSSALFVMSMNADLWPLGWPLQPRWKFTGGSQSPCASIDAVLMETPTPISSNPLGRSVCPSQTHTHTHTNQTNKTWSRCKHEVQEIFQVWQCLGALKSGSTHEEHTCKHIIKQLIWIKIHQMIVLNHLNYIFSNK